MSPSASSPEPCCPPFERLFLLGCLVLAVVLRVLYAYHFRVDSDEPQHLHVVWGWTQGRLPYRDFFDNHMPLFQLAYAPLFHWLGERADILAPMRVALLPIYLGTIWIIASLGKTLVSERAGWWAAVAAAIYPPFFLISSEFRPDDLWALLWLAALLVLVRGPFNARRGWWAGLLLGLTFCISMKTSLMLAAMAVSGMTVLVLPHAPAPSWRAVVPGLGAMVAGMLVAPALVVLFFVWRGAGPEFYQCVIRHNVTVGRTNPSLVVKEVRKWCILFFLSILCAWAIYRATPERRLARAAFFLFLAVLSYFTLLRCFWPILTLEDYLPYWPGLFAALGPVVAYYLLRWVPYGPVVCGLVLAGEFGYLIHSSRPLVDKTTDSFEMVATALRMTDPDQMVLDAKGETIYRRRPIYPVLEGVTSRGIKAGRIENDFIKRLIETHTALATYRRMPRDVKRFLDANFVPIAFRLVVLGKVIYSPIAGDPVPRPEKLEFDLIIGNRYRMISDAGPELLTGELNGRPFSGEETLAPGHYTFVPKGGSGRIALVWAQSLERGFSPLAWITEDYLTPQD